MKDSRIKKILYVRLYSVLFAQLFACFTLNSMLAASLQIQPWQSKFLLFLGYERLFMGESEEEERTSDFDFILLAP